MKKLVKTKEELIKCISEEIEKTNIVFSEGGIIITITNNLPSMFDNSRFDGHLSGWDGANGGGNPNISRINCNMKIEKKFNNKFMKNLLKRIMRVFGIGKSQDSEWYKGDIKKYLIKNARKAVEKESSKVDTMFGNQCVSHDILGTKSEESPWKGEIKTSKFNQDTSPRCKEYEE